MGEGAGMSGGKAAAMEWDDIVGSWSNAWEVQTAGSGPQGSLPLKHLSWGKQVAVLTDARFSGVSTGACAGRIGPEALAGGPIGRLRDGDLVEIVVDRLRLEGRVDLVGADGITFGAAEGSRVLDARGPRPDLAPDPRLPDDTRRWAALQQAGGGAWGGCVYDADAIVGALHPLSPKGRGSG